MKHEKAIEAMRQVLLDAGLPVLRSDAVLRRAGAAFLREWEPFSQYTSAADKYAVQCFKQWTADELDREA